MVGGKEAEPGTTKGDARPYSKDSTANASRQSTSVHGPHTARSGIYSWREDITLASGPEESPLRPKPAWLRRCDGMGFTKPPRGTQREREGEGETASTRACSCTWCMYAHAGAGPCK